MSQGPVIVVVMPMTAVLDESRRLDVTNIDEVTWAHIHRARPPAKLTCPHCGGRMSAKRRLKTRFFAHRPGADCALAGREGPEHVRLKELLVTAVRDAGWRGDLEASVGQRTADVLATSPNGDRALAFEVQLAHQSEDDIVARSSDYAASGTPVVWVVKDVRRLGGWNSGPWIELAEDLVSGPLGRMEVRVDTHRCGNRRFNVGQPSWKDPPHPPTVAELIRSVLTDKVRWLPSATRWVLTSEVARFEEADRRRCDVEQQLDACRQAHQARLDAGLAVWRRRRRQAAELVAARLAEHGHGRCRIDLEERHSVAKAARVFTEGGLQFLICPMPALLFRANRRALRASVGVVAATEGQLTRLRGAGMRTAVLADGFVPPLPGSRLPESAAEVFRTLERKAAAAAVALTAPTWDAERGGWWITADGGVRFFVVAPRERPSTVSTSITDSDVWLVFSRKRDMPEDDARALTREQLHPGMLHGEPPVTLEARPVDPPLVTAVKIVARTSTAADERLPVMRAADELHAQLPRGVATGHSPVGGVDPTLARRVRIPDGNDILVVADASCMPDEVLPGQVVLQLDSDGSSVDGAATVVSTVADAVTAAGFEGGRLGGKRRPLAVDLDETHDSESTAPISPSGHRSPVDVKPESHWRGDIG